jgi:hypothetical protein
MQQVKILSVGCVAFCHRSAEEWQANDMFDLREQSETGFSLASAPLELLSLFAVSQRLERIMYAHQKLLG